MKGEPQENETIWQRIMQDMARAEGAKGYSSDLVSKLKLIKIDSEKIILEYPAGMFIDWVRMSYTASIAEAASRVLGGKREIDYAEGAKSLEENGKEVIPPAPLPEWVTAPKRRTNAKQARSHAGNKTQSQFNAKYRFDNYVVGQNNDLAYKAAQALVNIPDCTFNPLFIYGNSGMGKTHLMHAIGNELQATRKGMRVLYVTCEQFTNAYIEAIRKRGDALELFREKFRKVDVLLIDDVQFMARADRTQEEFFHTFNALFESGKKIVLSADCPAAQITKMADRLKTRFSQGMTVELSAPCYEMRLAILRQKLKDWNAADQFNDEILEFLARNITQSVRTLEGALVRASMYANFDSGCPSIDFLKANLSDLLTQKSPASVSIADIKRCVADEFQIRLEDLDSRRRLASLAHPRQLAMYLARRHTACSLQDIGAAFGRDHSTVLHALRSVESKLKTDPHFGNIVSRLEEAMN